MYHVCLIFLPGSVEDTSIHVGPNYHKYINYRYYATSTPEIIFMLEFQYSGVGMLHSTGKPDTLRNCLVQRGALITQYYYTCTSGQQIGSKGCFLVHVNCYAVNLNLVLIITACHGSLLQ